MDLGVSAAVLLNQTVSGPVLPADAPNAPNAANPDPGPLTDQISNTVGEHVNIRYIVRPAFGLEFNFVNARYTENFCCNADFQGINLGVQTGAREFTLGYIVTPKQTFFGVHPFASVGAGSTEFIPTAHGGQSLPKQARATYYYSIGAQEDISPHFGLRVAFRQTFFLAPDFLQNYLTILQHTTSYEPTAGFYMRF